jgi:hypothetical protein
MSEDAVSSPRGAALGLRRRALHKRWPAFTGLLAAAFLFIAPLASAQAATVVPLGTDSSFAVLAASAVTNTGPSVISGNVGLSPGTNVTGFPPGTVNAGAFYVADNTSLQAQSDLTTAYNAAAAQTPTMAITADLGGSTLTSGVYRSTTSMGLTGDLTLDAQGNPNAVFIFQAGTTLSAATGSRVLLTGDAQACNVFWQVGDSATIGLSSAFAGTIMAMNSVTLTTGASLQGRALARNAAVTLDTNAITTPVCATPPSTPVVAPSPVSTPTPVVAPPTVTAHSTTTTAGTAVTIRLYGSDPTGAPLTYTITSGPAHGTLGPIDQATATVTYTPARSYTGQDSFTYQATSVHGTSNTAISSLTITAANTAAAQAKARAKAKAKAAAVARAKAKAKAAAVARAKAKAKAQAAARARAKAKARSTSHPSVTTPAFTG